jgi:hypothetical protein
LFGFLEMPGPFLCPFVLISICTGAGMMLYENY